jgi:hypothetical protein
MSQDQVNIFYSPALENPPMDGCSITYTTISKETEESTRVTIREGINNIPEDDWESIKAGPHGPHALRLLELGALRVMESNEVKEVLSEADLKVPDDVSIAALKLPDATKVITGTHDLQRLTAWLEQDQRVPVRTAIQKRIDTLTGGS